MFWVHFNVYAFKMGWADESCNPLSPLASEARFDSVHHQQMLTLLFKTQGLKGICKKQHGHLKRGPAFDVEGPVFKANGRYP